MSYKSPIAKNAQMLGREAKDGAPGSALSDTKLRLIELQEVRHMVFIFRAHARLLIGRHLLALALILTPLSRENPVRRTEVLRIFLLLGTWTCCRMETVKNAGKQWPDNNKTQMGVIHGE